MGCFPAEFSVRPAAGTGIPVSAEQFSVSKIPVLIYLGGLSARDASQAEHKKILQACQKKDAARAVKTLQQHLSRASDRLVAFLSDNADTAINEVKS